MSYKQEISCNESIRFSDGGKIEITEPFAEEETDSYPFVMGRGISLSAVTQSQYTLQLWSFPPQRHRQWFGLLHGFTKRVLNKVKILLNKYLIFVYKRVLTIIEYKTEEYFYYLFQRLFVRPFFLKTRLVICFIKYDVYHIRISKVISEMLFA